MEKKEEKIKFHIKLVKPHENVSRPVEEKDHELVFRDSREMIAMMGRLAANTRTQIFALSHAQVTKKPLRFFVLNPFDQHIQGALRDKPHKHTIYANPVIVNHTKAPIQSEEGCVTFLDRGNVQVQRFNKLVVSYDTFEKPKEKGGEVRFVHVENEDFNGLLSRIVQHEIDHMDAKYVFDPKKK